MQRILVAPILADPLLAVLGVYPSVIACSRPALFLTGISSTIGNIAIALTAAPVPSPSPQSPKTRLILVHSHPSGSSKPALSRPSVLNFTLPTPLVQPLL